MIFGSSDLKDKKIGDYKLKHTKIILSAYLLVMFFANIHAQNQEAMIQFSLFNEDQKNKLYESAYEYGWNVINMDPAPFVKYRLFPKMEDVLFYMHDSVAVTEEEKTALADTTLYFYEQAVKYDTDRKAYFLARKAFVIENWTDRPAEDAIEAYKIALEADPDLDTYYQDRLGLLLANNATQENGYKLEALNLYTKLSEAEPDNATWISRIENLAEDADELVEITYKSWQFDKENMEKAWKYASIAMRNNYYEKALEPLEFLVSKSPDVINYWNQLATAYQKLDRMDKAIEAYKKLIELQPDNAEHYVNLALMYKNQGQLAASRSYLQKAMSVNPSWDYPLYIEGTLYEQAARSCGFEFMDKLVYLLAVNTYREAAAKGGAYSATARERISALSNSIPSQEDYFFRKLKSGDTIKIEGKCYDWINRSVTIP